MTTRAPLLEARSVTRQFGSLHVLEGADFTLNAGEIIAVVGRSGSGKTTLLNLIGGLDIPDSGDVLIQGQPLSAMSDRQLAAFRNRTVGFVFQNYLLRGSRTALDNVILPLLIAGDTLRAARARGLDALNRVGLGPQARMRVSRLSGGQRQRVAIARAVATQPPLLLADEPTGNLDEETARSIYSLLLDLRANENTGIVCVTHDPLAREFGIPCVTIAQGKIVEYQGSL